MANIKEIQDKNAEASGHIKNHKCHVYDFHF